MKTWINIGNTFNIFKHLIIKNSLLLILRKMKLFQRKVNIVGIKITNKTIQPVNRVIEFADKFPNEIKDITQLQRFLGV